MSTYHAYSANLSAITRYELLQDYHFDNVLGCALRAHSGHDMLCFDLASDRKELIKVRRRLELCKHC